MFPLIMQSEMSGKIFLFVRRIRLTISELHKSAKKIHPIGSYAENIGTLLKEKKIFKNKVSPSRAIDIFHIFHNQRNLQFL